MLGFLGRRLGWAVVLFLTVTLYTYVLFFVMPYESARIGARSDAAVSTTVAEELDVHGSLVGEYLQFLGHVVRLDLGDSWTSGRRPVVDQIAAAAPVTASLVLFGIVFFLLIAFPIGILSALRPRSLLDRLGMLVVLVGLAAHPLWIGYMLAYVFGRKLGWFPVDGYCDLFRASTYCGGPAEWAQHLVLPAFAFALGFAALYARMIRASVAETMHEDWIRTARAKGLSEWGVVRHHALRGALLPVVTMIGVDMSAIWLANGIFVERAFGLPGVWSLLYGSLVRRDMPVVVGIVVLVTTVIILANLVVDLLYALIDPRIRPAQGSSGRNARSKRARRWAPATVATGSPATKSIAVGSDSTP